jgi:hypothetical protein
MVFAIEDQPPPKPSAPPTVIWSSLVSIPRPADNVRFPAASPSHVVRVPFSDPAGSQVLHMEHGKLRQSGPGQDGPAGLDEGLPPLCLSNLVNMENPHMYKECQ